MGSKGKGKKKAVETAALPRFAYSVHVESAASHGLVVCVVADCAIGAIQWAMRVFTRDGFVGAPRVKSLTCHGEVR